MKKYCQNIFNILTHQQICVSLILFVVSHSEKIEMFTDKGGVGKTTMSVATALQHAEVGKTLLISTDPPGALSEIFSRPLDRKVHTVAPNLDAVELTRKLVLELWRKKSTLFYPLFCRWGVKLSTTSKMLRESMRSSCSTIS